MGKTPLKKVIKSKLKANKELTPEEALRERMKYDIVVELGLENKVNALGWSSLTAEETGRIGGIMTKRKKGMNTAANANQNPEQSPEQNPEQNSGGFF